MIVMPMPPFGLGSRLSSSVGATWASGSVPTGATSANYSYRMLLGLGTDIGMLTAIAMTVITTAIAVP